MMIASITYQRPDGTFLALLENGWPYHVIQSDPLYPLAAEMGADAPYEPEPVGPSLADRRAEAKMDRGPLCKALRAAGILSDASAVVAAKGDWPAEFEGVLEAMAPTTRVDAQIDWADASVVRYQNPLLQSVAVAWCNGDEAQASALLDQLFGLA